MANWKKVVVSGSNVSQLNNDIGYLTFNTLITPNAFSTASFGSTNLLANSPSGTLNFASSSTQGLTIVADAGSDTLTFGLSQIPNSSLFNTGSIIGNTPIDLGSTIATINSLTLTNTTATGSFTGSFIGDGSELTGIATNLAISGSVGNGSVALKTQVLSILGTNNEIETNASGQTVTIGLPNDVTINNNLIVNNNLTVQGTASFQNTTNLEVADRFILMASGSNTTGDGGIVVQQATQNVGELFGWDSGVSRWGVTGSFTANNASYTPDAFMSAVSILASTNPNTSGPASRYNANGNIYVSSGDESIWIYS
jgi:hypothetical protein